MKKQSLPLIKIITGSVRPGRFNIQPATWIHELAQKRSDFSVELIDLATVNLPFHDEAVPPLMNQYTHDHTRAWSQVIEQADGFIFVTPEYNHSFSPVLKNAIDYLNREWSYKPVSFVSYGSQAGGARAVEHLRGVAGELKMFDLREQVLLPNYWENLDEKGQFRFEQSHDSVAQKVFDELAFWSLQMKAIRQKM